MLAAETPRKLFMADWDKVLSVLCKEMLKFKPMPEILELGAGPNKIKVGALEAEGGMKHQMAR